MGTDRRRNRVLTVLLVLAVTGNLFWLMRLEAQAQATSRLLEHHADLDANIDTLEGLTEFRRRVGNFEIRVDNDGVAIETAGVSATPARLSISEGVVFLGANPADGSHDNFFNLYNIQGRPTATLGVGRSRMKIKDGGLELLSPGDNGWNNVLIEERGISLISSKGTPEELRLDMFSPGWFSLRNAGDHKIGLFMAEDFNYVQLFWDNTMLKLHGDGRLDLLAERDILIRSTGGDVRIEGQRVLLNE
jgi:hypothetical protein